MRTSYYNPQDYKKDYEEGDDMVVIDEEMEVVKVTEMQSDIKQEDVTSTTVYKPIPKVPEITKFY
jgi:broad specificity polyphosphatase/5'/3'-nucleotidase SurE